jgi:phenol hydroxylase P1 protein
MNIDLHTVSIQPIRQAFDHLIRRFGDKPASRYQEASYDIQSAEHFHYKPTWDQSQALFDASISKIVMKDWYALKDPRQFYYNTYTLTRARQQDTTEANFDFVETRGLCDMIDSEIKDIALKVLIPLRHAAWGANQNNTFICAYGYGTVFTQPCIYHAMDNLGIAQYISRLGLLLGDTEALDEAKTAWLSGEAWQPLRHYIEDCLVLRDPFELFVAQNAALDGLLYPMVYERIVNGFLSSNGASSIAMLTQFMTDWFTETRKWIDAVISVAAKESEANKALLEEWTTKWSARAAKVVLPIATIGLGEQAEATLNEELASFKARMNKAGINI